MLHSGAHAGKKLGQTVLYFGCRNSKQDFIYEEELNEYLAKGVLSNMYVAFSREQVSRRASVWECNTLLLGIVALGNLYWYAR